MTRTIAAQYSITDEKSARDAAAECDRSRYADEIEAFEDSRRYREINAVMRTNRAAFL